MGATPILRAEKSKLFKHMNCTKYENSDRKHVLRIGTNTHFRLFHACYWLPYSHGSLAILYNE